MLRSGKLFCRVVSGFTRNLVVNTVRETDNGLVLQQTPCLCNQLPHCRFVNNAAPKNDVDLEKQLRRLDQDVRRFGRISRRDIEEVLEEIRSQRSATSSQSLMMIRCCGNLVPEETPEVRTALVQEIWKTLNTLNVPMDISHYNALLRVYLENEHPFSPTDFLAEIEAKSIEPNRVTYQRLIARYCQTGDIDGATRILEYMREKKLPVNEHVFNSLILGHSQANDLESSKGILSMMKQAGLEPSADTYTTLLCCYARHGDMAALLSTLEECESKEIVLLDKDLLDVVYTLAVNGHSDRVDEMLAKLKINTGFNQDAVNVILRLVNKGHEDVGLQVLRKMPRGVRPDGQLIDAGTFFIKQLMKANRPIEKVLQICKQMQDEGLNPKALLIATETGLTNGIANHALPLLKEMKNAGLPIRQHYFWPIICAVEPNRVIEIVRHMQNEFSLNPTPETLRDYVIPNLKEKNWDRIITLLRDLGVSPGVAASSAAFTALSSYQMNEAAQIMESYKAYYMPALFRQPLVTGFTKTNDIDGFVRIIRQIHESSLKKQPTSGSNQPAVEQDAEEIDASAQESEMEPLANVSQDVVGSILLDIVSYFRRERVEILSKLLPKLVDQGISISSAKALRLSDRLASEMTPEISEHLGKMSSGELELKALKTNSSKKRTLNDLSIDELERFIANVEAKGENSNNLNRQLINACFRSKNLEKTIQVIEKLEQQNYSIPLGVYAQLIDLYVDQEKSSDALAQYEKLRAKDEKFVIDNLKTIRLVNLLLKEERFDEAIRFLEQNKKDKPYAEGEGSFNYMTTVWRVLNSLAETGNVEKLQKLFDALILGNYIMPTNVVLGPLIKVHLVKDDIKSAIDTFEKLCQQYSATPWKNELACRLIQQEDAANLQRLTDLSTNIHGEINSLYDLVFSFVECGRIRQARKILETPGLRTRPHRIDTACERYKNEGMVESLEGLMEATKDLNHIDRSKICFNLLLSYSKSNDVDKAISLWTKMQEESILLTDTFLLQLAELLKKNNRPIPFVVPQLKDSNQSSTKPQTVKASTTETKYKKPVEEKKSLTEEQKSSNLILMRRAINSGDTETAIQLKSQLMSGETASATDVSRIIEQLVQAGRSQLATKYVEELLSEQRMPQIKIFKFYLNKIAASGDVETIQRLGERLSDEQKRLLSYDNRLCHANISAGRVEEYLKRLKDEISGAKSPEEASKLAAKFPRGGALGILEKHPEMTAQFEEIAECYATHNQLGPINVLWMHLISNGDEKASKAIWNKHLSSAPRLMFQRVLQTARDQNNGKLAENIIDQLRGSKISEGAIGNAYSCLIDIHMANNNVDKALETLKTALKDVCLENINRTAVLRLRTSLEEQNKEFPYVIPEKKIKNNITSSSSSSSDDDVEPKKPETRPPKPETRPTKPTQKSNPE